MDDRAMWLPIKYQSMASDLRDAAEKLESTEECERVIRASLKKPPKGGHAGTFLIICKDVQNETFSAMVDAASGDVTLSSDIKKAKPLVIDAALRDKIYEDCDAAIQNKTQYMKSMEIMDGQRKKFKIEDNKVISYHVDFNAQSMSGESLKYRATCQYVNKRGAKVSISPRR